MYYELSDTLVKQQVAIPPKVLRLIQTNAIIPREKFIARLISGIYFFACRSC